MSRLRPRSARGRLQDQNDYVLFVILVTHPKSYIETTDRRDFGGKPSKWRWGRVLSWKIPKFSSVGGARSQNSIFSRFRVPFDYPAHSLQVTVYPKPMVPMESTETLKVCFLLVWRVCDQAFGKWMMPKSGHVTITKIENLHIDTRRKIHWFQKCYSFRSTTKNNEVISETLSEQWRHQTLVDPWPSLIDARRQRMLLVISQSDQSLNQNLYFRQCGP